MTKKKQLRILSSGGGVNSAACQAEYIELYDAIAWADTGDESPETYAYVENHLKPHAARHGVPFITVKSKDTVLEEAARHKKVSFYFKQRQCTTRHKIRPILEWVRKQRPKPNKDNPCIIDIGFASDESDRIGPDYKQQYATKNYPLCYDHITRTDCKKIIEKAGLPVPPKSACEFCPFAGRKHMRSFSAKHPEQFDILLQAEERDPKFPKYTIFKGHKLRTIISNRKLAEFPSEGCESGHCLMK